MKSSPIYNIISNPSRKSDCLFGSVDGYRQDIRVGTSSVNSHTLAKISVEKHVRENGDATFNLFLDGVLVKKGTLKGKEFTFVVASN